MFQVAIMRQYYKINLKILSSVDLLYAMYKKIGAILK
jgi:hypothetical protein